MCELILFNTVYFYFYQFLNIYLSIASLVSTSSSAALWGQNTESMYNLDLGLKENHLYTFEPLTGQLRDLALTSSDSETSDALTQIIANIDMIFERFGPFS